MTYPSSSFSRSPIRIFLSVALLHCLAIVWLFYAKTPPRLQSSSNSTITVSLIDPNSLKKNPRSSIKKHPLQEKKKKRTKKIRKQPVQPTKHVLTQTTEPTVAAKALPKAETETAPLTDPDPSSTVAAQAGQLQCKIIKPNYPSLSQKRGEIGIAYVSFTINQDGKLFQVKLKKSSGFHLLDQAALTAVQASHCKPYLQNGTAVAASYTQPFSFGLNEDD